MKMNIMYAANDDIIEGLELSIWSLLTFNKNVNIYVATMTIGLLGNGMEESINYRSITKEHREWLTKIVKYLDYNSNICFLDCEETYSKYLEGSVNEYCGFTPYASLRLIADILLPDVNNILYLDADTAIQGNLEGMYNQYINNNPYSYAISCCYDAFDGKGEDVSGVLLMNLNKMKHEKFLEKARKFYMKNQYVFPDQMAIRDTGPGLRLPETYGYMEELESCPYTPVILHFTNHLSPKIYQKNRPDHIEYFYKRYPQFKYVQEGLDKLRKFTMFL